MARRFSEDTGLPGGVAPSQDSTVYSTSVDVAGLNAGIDIPQSAELGDVGGKSLFSLSDGYQPENATGGTTYLMIAGGLVVLVIMLPKIIGAVKGI